MINIANSKKTLDQKKDAALLAKHFKVSVDAVMEGYVSQEYSFSFKSSTGYIIAGRANGPLEAEVYANDSGSGEPKNVITVSNAQNIEINAESKNSVKLENGLLYISTRPAGKKTLTKGLDTGQVTITVSYNGDSCSFKSIGDEASGLVGNGADILNALVQELFMGNALKMK